MGDSQDKSFDQAFEDIFGPKNREAEEEEKRADERGEHEWINRYREEDDEGWRDQWRREYRDYWRRRWWRKNKERKNEWAQRISNAMQSAEDNVLDAIEPIFREQDEEADAATRGERDRVEREAERQAEIERRLEREAHRA